jgi:hypothetical protein
LKFCDIENGQLDPEVEDENEGAMK